MNRREFLARARTGALGGSWVLDGALASGRARSSARERVESERERDPRTHSPADPQADTYRNPVYEHVFPDPDVLRVGGTYYAYGTYHPWKPGVGPDRELISILESRNLVDWTPVGPAFEEKPPWSRYRGLWAPGVGRLQGRTLLYYSDSEFGADDPGIGVATARTPTGPFEPRGGLFRSQDIGVPNSIDPMLFVGERSVLFWGSHHGIYGIPLADDGLSVEGEKFRIAGGGVEAPYVIERDGFFYFFGSRGSCCRGLKSTYRVVVGRAETLRGPYRNRAGKRLTTGGVTGTTILRSGEQFVGPGHCAVVRDGNGGWWMLYHAYERGKGWVADTPRRVLMLDRIRWVNGWSVVGDGTPSVEGRVPLVGD